MSPLKGRLAGASRHHDAEKGTDQCRADPGQDGGWQLAYLDRGPDRQSVAGLHDPEPGQSGRTDCQCGQHQLTDDRLPVLADEGCPIAGSERPLQRRPRADPPDRPPDQEHDHDECG